MNDQYNITYYNLSESTLCDKGFGEQIEDILWDEDYTNKAKVLKAYAKALKTASKGNRVEVMVFKGCKDDEHALYIGQLDINGFFRS